MAYATAADFIEHLRLTPNASLSNAQAQERTAYIEALLDVAAERINTACGRHFDDAGTVTRTYRLLRHTRLLDLRSDWHDITTVVSDGTTLDSDDYVAERFTFDESRPYRLLRRVDGLYWGIKVDVTGEGGWSSTPATVKEASLVHVGRYWLRRSTPGGSMSSDGEVMMMPNLDRDLLDMLDTFCVGAGA